MLSPKKKFMIGRDPGCDIVITSETVSARHAELSYLDDGKLLLTDCKSRNGTYRLQQNGSEASIRQELVSPLDRVRFGDVRLSMRELLDSLRLKHPYFEQAAPNATRAPAKARNADAMERCDCGAVKPVHKRCSVCGR